MKTKVLALLLLAAYFLGTLRPYTPYLEYRINKSYIAAYLCENRSMPDLKCEGNCYLMKQLQKSNKPSERESPVIYDFELNFAHTLVANEISFTEISIYASKTFFSVSKFFDQPYLELESPPPQIS